MQRPLTRRQAQDTFIRLMSRPLGENVAFRPHRYPKSALSMPEKKDDQMHLASNAVIVGLQSKPKLNGCRASVISWHAGSGRWVVKLDGSDEGIRIRSSNLLISANLVGEDEDDEIAFPGGDDWVRIGEAPGALPTWCHCEREIVVRWDTSEAAGWRVRSTKLAKRQYDVPSLAALAVGTLIDGGVSAEELQETGQPEQVVSQVQEMERERSRTRGGLLSFTAPHNVELWDRLMRLLLPQTDHIDTWSGEGWSLECHRLHGCRYVLPVLEAENGVVDGSKPMALSDGEGAYLALIRQAWRAVDSVAPGWRVRCEPPICVLPYAIERAGVRFADPLCFGLHQLSAHHAAAQEAAERCRRLAISDDSFDLPTRELAAELTSHQLQFGPERWPPYVRGTFRRNERERTWDMKRRATAPEWAEAEDEEIEEVVLQLVRRVEARLTALGVPMVRADEDSRSQASYTEVFSRLESGNSGGMYDDRRHVVYSTMPEANFADEDMGASYDYDVQTVIGTGYVARGIAPDAGVGGGGWQLAKMEDDEDEEEAGEEDSSGDEWESSQEQVEREQRWHEEEEARAEHDGLQAEKAQKEAIRAHAMQQIATGAPPPHPANASWQEVVDLVDERLAKISIELLTARSNVMGFEVGARVRASDLR